MTHQQRQSTTPRPRKKDPTLGDVIAARWQLCLEEWAINLHHRIAKAVDQRQDLAAELNALPRLAGHQTANSQPNTTGGNSTTTGSNPHAPVPPPSAQISFWGVMKLRCQLWNRQSDNQTLLDAIRTQKQHLATEQLLRECDSVADPVDQLWLTGARPDFEVYIDDEIIERIALIALVHFGPLQRHRTGPDWNTWVAQLEKRFPRYTVTEIVNRTTALLSKMRGTMVTPFTYETAWNGNPPARKPSSPRQI